MCGRVAAGSGDVFFFQAEDGIRDDLVTGVQTCALPIFTPPISRRRRNATWRVGRNAFSSSSFPSTVRGSIWWRICSARWRAACSGRSGCTANRNSSSESTCISKKSMQLLWYSDGSTRWMRSLLINYLDNEDLVRTKAKEPRRIAQELHASIARYHAALKTSLNC